MINKEDFYLKDIELCKQLEPIMKKKGLEADGYWVYMEHGILASGWSDLKINLIEKNSSTVPIDSGVPTYRKDSLEAALPEWVWQYLPKEIFGTCGKDFNGMRWSDRFVDLKAEAICGDARGQNCLIALAELIVLLDKDGVV